MKWFLTVLRNYADFNGRARRTEYWMFTLFNMIFAIFAIVADNAFGLTFDAEGFGFLYLFYILAMLIPSLAVGVRRLHDTGKSGWMMLIALIPLIGSIWLLVLFATNGTPGENEYGLNPKEEFTIS